MKAIKGRLFYSKYKKITFLYRFYLNKRNLKNKKKILFNIFLYYLFFLFFIVLLILLDKTQFMENLKIYSNLDDINEINLFWSLFQ